MPDGQQATPRTLRSLQIGLQWFESGAGAGGLDRVYAGLVHDLPGAGIEADGIVVGPDDAAARSGGRVHGIGCAAANLPTRIRAARRAIGRAVASGRYDLVASHFAILTAPALDHLRSLPLVVHFHGPWAAESEIEGQGGLAVRAKRTLERLALSRATRVITLSQAFADLAHETLGVRRDRLRVVPGSADLPRFDVGASRAEARARLGLPADRRILVAVRRLANRMGLDDLLDALPAIVAAHPDVLVLIGGKGARGDALRAQASALGLDAHVRFLGFVADDDLPLLYRAADLNLVPTVALEGFGLTTVEALAAGTPSMVTPVGGLPEIVTPLAPDLVFDGTGPAAIGRGLARFLEGAIAVPDADAIRAFSRRFAADRVAAATAAVYRDAVAEWEARHPHGRVRPRPDARPPAIAGAIPSRSRPAAPPSASRRILAVSHAGATGGAEMILLDVARHWGAACAVVLFADGPFRTALERRGLDVRVLAAGGGMMGVTREAHPLRALGAGPAVARQAARLARLARGFDVVYANSQKAGVVAMLAAPLHRRPVVWHMHDILSAEHFAGLQRRVSVRLANRLRVRVIVISEAARRSFVAVGGDPALVRVVPNGIDEAVYAGATPLPRAALGVPDGARLVGLFGRLSHWKGQDVLVDAMAALPADVHALVVGDALFGEASFRDALLARVDRLGLGDRVHLLGHREDVPALMATCDLVVHCSTAPEPFGRVIVEAMLGRRPVIASADGATAEILGADYPGLVTPNAPPALADAIGRFLALEDADRAALVEANAARARARFTVERMTARIDAVLDEAAPMTIAPQDARAGVAPQGAPAAVAPQGAPAAVAPPDAPAAVAAPDAPAVVAAPDAPAAVASPDAPAAVASPDAPAVVAAPDAPAVVAAPDARAGVASPGAPAGSAPRGARADRALGEAP